MVAEAAGAGQHAEQAMDRERLRRQALAQVGGQVRGALADRVQHPRGGLAGRRRQAIRQSGLPREHAGEHVDDGGRLAGAGAAADDRQRRARSASAVAIFCQSGRSPSRCGVGGEQAVEQRPAALLGR